MKKLAIAGLVVLAIGVGFYFYNKNKVDASSSGDRNKTNEADFNDLSDTAKKNGSDVFDGTPAQLLQLKAKYLKNITKQEHRELKSLFDKKEKNWTPAEKLRFYELASKWMDKKVVA